MINKYTLLATGYAVFVSLLLYLILRGRVEAVFTYVGIAFILSWFSVIMLLGLAKASGEADEMMEEEWERRREVE